MRLLNGYNFVAATMITILTDIFRQYGIVLASFLMLNLIDWITGTCKAHIGGRESSVAGLKGICKKLGYWVLIFVAFVTGKDLAMLAGEMGFAFVFADYIGWLTLSMLVVNEARSITENLVEMGVAVPKIFSKGLSIAQNTLEATLSQQEDKETLVEGRISDN